MLGALAELAKEKEKLTALLNEEQVQTSHGASPVSPLFLSLSPCLLVSLSLSLSLFIAQLTPLTVLGPHVRSTDLTRRYLM